MIRLLTLVAALLLVSTFSSAQLSSFEGADGKAMVRVAARIGYAKNAAVDFPQARGIGIFTVDTDIFRSNFKKGGVQAYHRWPFVWDVWWPLVGSVVRGNPDIAQKGSTSFSSFILGWHQNTFSIVSRQNLNVALGVHYGDYFYSYQPYDVFTNQYANAMDPGGWFGAIGPAVTVDYALPIGGLFLHYDGGFPYGFSWKKTAGQVTTKGYPNPIFLNNLVELRYRNVFANFEYVRVVNRGTTPSEGYRVNYSLGFWF